MNAGFQNASDPQAANPGGFSARGICKRFLADNVLTNVDLDVRRGEVVALLGENGAGKSTLSGIIAGSLPPDTGSMQWEGRAYSPASPGEAIAAGIGLIHQEMRLLPDLSIAENVFVGRIPTKGGFVDRGAMVAKAERQMHRLGLDVPATTLVRKLKVAAQQQVEIAKALMLDARLLILDEPTAALGGDETERLFEQVERLKAEGVSFIYISHRLEEIARIADRIVVLRDGRVVAHHETARVAIPTLVEEMVGRSVDRLFPRLEPATAKPVLEVSGLSSPAGAFRDVSFSVHAGEIFGVAGIVGAGRTELVRAISGADPIAAGSVRVDGATLRLRSPRDAIAAGIVLVPEDRKGEGVIVDQKIDVNLAYSNLDHLSRGGWLTSSRISRFASECITRLGVKGRPDQLIGRLSGGNQQKVVIAKWLARSPRVVILDEPTRGIDVGARAAIYEIIAGLARGGAAVVVVSSDLDEVLGLSHRVMVLSRGRQRGILGHEEATNVAVMELATA